MLAAFIGIVALGQTFVIIGGGIDLSVPWVLNAAAVLMTLAANGQHGAPLVYVVPLLLAAGALVGVVNGLGVALFGVPPIIMTLAVNVILQGGILVFTGGAPTATAPPAIQFLAVGRIAGFPVIVLIWIVLARCCDGAVAGAERLRPLPLRRTAPAPPSPPSPAYRRCATTVGAYTLSGFAAALAGMLLTGYTAQAYLGMGDPYLFTSIAAVAIGGASILGGSGTYLSAPSPARWCSPSPPACCRRANLSERRLLVVYGVVILGHGVAGERIAGGLFSAAFSRRLSSAARSSRATRRTAMIEIECVVDAGALLGEWHLLGTSTTRCRGGSTSQGSSVHCYDPATRVDETVALPEYLGCLAT